MINFLPVSFYVSPGTTARFIDLMLWYGIAHCPQAGTTDSEITHDARYFAAKACFSLYACPQRHIVCGTV